MLFNFILMQTFFYTSALWFRTGMNETIQKLLIQKAGMFLARRSYSRGELQDKLLKFAEKEQVAIALDRLESLNLLNDADYAYNFALCRIERQGWGPSKVRNSLLNRQVNQTEIDSAMARIESERTVEFSIDFYVKQYCKKKGRPSSLKDIRKMMVHLHHQGFEKEDVFRAIQEAVPDLDLHSFETGE
jgi:SOS response regulatory protein OraA/RecX